MPCMHACLALNIGATTRAAVMNGWCAAVGIASLRLSKCAFTYTPPLLGWSLLYYKICSLCFLAFPQFSAYYARFYAF